MLYCTREIGKQFLLNPPLVISVCEAEGFGVFYLSLLCESNF